MPISQCIPLSFPLYVYMFVLYTCVSIPALEIRFICTIFLDLTYMRYYTIFVFLFLTVHCV